MMAATMCSSSPERAPQARRSQRTPHRTLAEPPRFARDVDGELLHGFENKGGEIGHMIIQPNGRQCGCTQKGCIEAYSSASSTAARATEAIQAGGESSLKQLLDANGEITCKDVFDHVAAGDKLAKEITDATACPLCEDRPCTYVCPANLYQWLEDQLVHTCEGCLECGSCRIVCDKEAVEWALPRACFGICYLFG